jgi:hypothetical protein
VHERFKSTDCSKQQCLVSVAPPTSQPNSNDDPHVLIYFG